MTAPRPGGRKMQRVANRCIGSFGWNFRAAHVHTDKDSLQGITRKDGEGQEMAKPTPRKGTKGSSSALARALRFEKQGKKFFMAAAAKASDEYARRMFALLASMEDKHVQDILAISRTLEGNGKFPAVSSAPSDDRMKIFRRETARIRKETLFTGDAAAVMRKALAFEAEGREMYSRMSQSASHPQEKKFFRLLSGEEQAHFDIVYEYLDSFENVGLRMRED